MLFADFISSVCYYESVILCSYRTCPLMQSNKRSKVGWNFSMDVYYIYIYYTDATYMQLILPRNSPKITTK